MFIIIWEITPWPIAWSLYEPVTHLKVEKRWPGGPAAKDSPPFWHSPALALSLFLYQNHYWLHNLQSSPVLNRSDFCQLQSRDKPHPIKTRNHHCACKITIKEEIFWSKLPNWPKWPNWQNILIKIDKLTSLIFTLISSFHFSSICILISSNDIVGMILEYL